MTKKRACLRNHQADYSNKRICVLLQKNPLLCEKVQMPLSSNASASGEISFNFTIKAPKFLVYLAYIFNGKLRSDIGQIIRLKI